MLTSLRKVLLDWRATGIGASVTNWWIVKNENKACFNFASIARISFFFCSRGNKTVNKGSAWVDSFVISLVIPQKKFSAYKAK